MELMETSLFSIRLSAGSPEEAVDAIMARARAAAGGHVCVANADMVTRAKRDDKLREAMQAAAVVVTDGQPLVWMLRYLGCTRARRVRGPDLMLQVCAACAAEGVGVFLLGGTPAELDALRQALQRRFPRLHIAGSLSPGMLPADPPVDEAVIDAVQASGAGVLFVGLGCPKQEYWMLNHRGRLGSIAIGVGYAFALVAGLKQGAPAWMANHGLEWLHRLFQEPRRLSRRYLVGNSLFVWYSIQELLRPRRS